MQCRSVLTRIDALRTGELEPDEQRKVSSHLERCSSCNDSAHDVEEFAATVQLLASSSIREPEATVLDSLCDRFDSFEVDDLKVWVVFTARGIKRVDLHGGDAGTFTARYREETGREVVKGTIPDEYRKAIVAALHGEATDLPSVDLSSLTPFEREVLETIRRIPRGQVRTYEWVARAVHRPKAVRAIGNVMASNPVPLLFPCHRVVPTSGGIGNYGYGSEMKRTLLEVEGAPVDEIEELGRRRVRFVGSKTTKIFCCPTCRDARRIREENRVYFHDAAEAETQGFRPCRSCAPAAA